MLGRPRRHNASASTPSSRQLSTMSAAKMPSAMKRGVVRSRVSVSVPVRVLSAIE
ncbi:hypothetical protein GA0115246_100982 [Streptomyces sp. SolWspMP-sol7th]|nr:hypothetical protein GA0115246_100982 [Streptomyces sp. SolWspMP-sol7th]